MGFVSETQSASMLACSTDRQNLEAGESVMRGERLSFPLFLKTSREIQRIKKEGRRISTAWFNLLICTGQAERTQLAIVIGRRFGAAVRRNRAKRLFRELARSVRDAWMPGYVFLVFPKRECLTLSFDELRQVWNSTLQKQRLARFDRPCS
jgi:ribonuclease P protein component